jgi:hypothetical protein
MGLKVLLERPCAWLPFINRSGEFHGGHGRRNLHDDARHSTSFATMLINMLSHDIIIIAAKSLAVTAIHGMLSAR